ncbi:MAG: hypothetical protein RL266_1396 [Bacteroidota bacterium]
MFRIYLIVVGLSLILQLKTKAQSFLDSVYPGFISIEEVVFADSNERNLFLSDFDQLSTMDKLTALSRTAKSNVAVSDGRWLMLINRVKEIKRPKKNEKYIDNIYQEVHNTLLRKYELQTSFDRIFSDGVYNCVTASALYALVFDELNIPYELKQLPTHVYIIAYPEEQIVVESTNPRSGFYTLDENYKYKYVNELIENKLISASEASIRSVQDLFNEHYFRDKTIDFKQLLGLQYYNQGVYFMQNKEYRKAIKELEKASYLYPSGGNLYNMLVSMAKVLDDTDYKGERDILYLARMTRMPKEFELSRSHVMSAFALITNELLISKSDKVTYDSIYHELSSLMAKDDSLRNKIDLIYNYETARYYSLTGDYDASIPFVLKALKNEPSNLQTQGMVTDLLRHQFLEKYKKDVVDEVLVQQVLNIQDSIPEIWENTRFKQLYIDLYGAVIAVKVEQGDHAESLDMLMKLEALADDIALVPEQNITSYICSEIAKYYFKKGQYGNARKATTMGLKYYPNDGLLKTIERQLR